MKHLKATGIIRIVMDRFGVYGLSTPWNAAYYMDDPSIDIRIIKHEMKHLEQMKRDGKIKFLIKYFWYIYKFGYYNNPYEIEARKSEI